MIHRLGKSWLLTNDTAFFVKKTAYNQERFWEIDWEVLCFYCPDNYLRQVFKEFRQQLPLKDIPAPSKDMILEINVNAVTRAFFYSIVPYFTQAVPPSESILELKFKELFFDILSNPANAGLLAYVNSLSDQHKPPLHEIMEANFNYNLSLTDFARMTQRSLATFKRDFIEIYHTTPGKWLTQKRLEYAQLLLNTSKKNVNEIAYDSGFENATHFSRVFKEKFGSSPLRYRKKSLSLSLLDQ